MTPRRARSRADSSRNRPRLGELELEVMLVAWDLGEFTSGDVIEAFREKRALAASTLRNVLAKLRAKGYLEPIPAVGRGFRMRATVGRDAVAKRHMRTMLASFFEGSPREAIASLLDEAEVTDADLDAIRSMLEARARREEKR